MLSFDHTGRHYIPWLVRKISNLHDKKKKKKKQCLKLHFPYGPKGQDYYFGKLDRPSKIEISLIIIPCLNSVRK